MKTRKLRPGFRVATCLFPLLVLMVAQASRPRDKRAQEAVVQGILIDSTTSRTLESATVVLEQAGREVRSVLSDRNGLFQAPGLPPDSYVLRITLFGYVDHEERIQLATGESVRRSRANSGPPPGP